MRAIIQRVSKARVTVDGQVTAEIGQGLMILLGIGSLDQVEAAQFLAKKIANLRIFSDADDKMNLSVKDVGGSAIVVSQFTLYADARKGNRPSYTAAATPEIAAPLVEQFIAFLQAENVPCGSGVFGAHMVLDIQNNGPVTIMLER